MTGAHNTNPASRIKASNPTRPAADEVASDTAPVLSVPTAMTVTTTMAMSGRVAWRSAASIGAGRVRTTKR